MVMEWMIGGFLLKTDEELAKTIEKRACDLNNLRSSSLIFTL